MDWARSTLVEIQPAAQMPKAQPVEAGEMQARHGHFC
jgi:hypothetical protein